MFLVYSKVIQLYIYINIYITESHIYIYVIAHIFIYIYINKYIYVFFFRYFSIVGYYKIFDIVPCAMQ